ncbi:MULTISPECIES: spermidine/putrescine ABC transporter permease PotB [unclassified Pseudodesulfovibrio]|uniref:spermidine/putrescine ABC transporter permease PotB n=1 Tax=unclassified Pseudodesulfovibrio TaxID=2661612 RepID=UPI000FEBEC4B|nr:MULTISPECIES: spermidine/putrescine ABC transporter permease PotB [unclassified Pseudodesulfovibrio]MCJ2164556.1 spermidine/putrescine ABC transporter permease PotB [Pseudodesulfovibrio sp. S3-i]RWU04754.1 spermidine/putrescine ABC transporter permease PotB [Pseudodesulfovibrio sp. S3]
MKDNNLFQRLVLSGVLGWMALFGAVPALMLMGVSFLRRHPVDLIEPVFTLDNYVRLIEPALGSMLLKSLGMATTATLLCLIIGYPFAYIVARADKRYAKPMLLLVMIPFWTNTLIRTYALVAVLKADGIVNKVLLFLGIIDVPLKLMYSQTAVFIGLIYTLLPFMILPLYAAIEKLDQRLLEASRDLGASRWASFRKVTVPLTMPGIVSGCMLVFLPALGMFYIPDILGGARTMLLGNYIRDQFLISRDLPEGAAASIAMTLIMGLMLVLYFKSIRQVGRKVRI